MIIPDGVPPPQYMWVSAPVVHRIRIHMVSAGLPIIAYAAVVGATIPVMGTRLSTSWNPFNTFTIAMALVSVFFAFVCGLSLILSRNCARGEHLNVTETARVMRLMLAYWLGTIVVTLFSCFLLVAMVTTSGGHSSRPEVRFDTTYILYLALLVSPAIVGGVGFFTARYHLRPSPALLAKGGFHQPR